MTPQCTSRRTLHGVLLLDKALGLSSHAALQQAKRLYRAQKAGHTGTLDPLATGLLPLAFGAATKFAQASLEGDKSYRATLKLGQRTASGDAECPVIETRPVDCDRAAVEAACRRFVGPIDQLPPMTSALKKGGKALYEYARAGLSVERDTRKVRVHSITVVALTGDELVIDVSCTKGTYIRTLADDIGRWLGCGAYLVGLRRTASGALRIDCALTLEALAALSEAERDARLLPADTLLADWPRVQLPDDEAGRFLSGLRRRVTLADAPAVRVYGPQPGAFLGSAHITAGELIADRLMSPLEVRSLTET